MHTIQLEVLRSFQDIKYYAFHHEATNQEEL